MKYEDFMNLVSHDVSKIIYDNIENILGEIIKDVPASEYLKEEHIRLCKNTVTVSVQLSVQTVLSCLDSIGLLNIDSLQKIEERPQLSLIKGGLCDNPSDD